MGVRVGGPVENLAGRADLGDAARVQHRDAVRDLRGDTKVVGDEDDAATDLVAQPLEQAQHLGLDRHVESGGRFVGDDQVGVARDGHRDHHALAQTAGQLVREGPHPPLRLGDADRGQQPQRLLVATRGFGDLPADAHGGVQRGHRILEDGTEVEAPHLAQGPRRALDHVGTGDADGALGLGVTG